MDIKKTLKQKIISTVLSTNSQDWPILVYDRSCADILKNLFTKSEFITHNIIMSQFIEEDRDQVDFPVIYFVKCTKEISKIINSDYLNKKYSLFTVCTLIEPENLNLPYKVVNLDLKGLEERVFISNSLYSVCNILDTYFYIEYTSNTTAKFCEELELKLKNHSRSGKLIVFDRSIDLFTPFLHFFTFQPLLEDINLTNMSKLYEEYGETKLWKDVRHAHLGDIPDLLRSYVRKITTSKKNTDNMKDLMKMVIDAPETLKTNEMLKFLYDITEKCYTKLDYFKKFNNVEQTICSGKDKNHKKKKLKNDEIMKCLIDREIEEEDRKRIFLLYKYSGYIFTDRELTIIKKSFKNESEFKEEFEFDKYTNFKPFDYDYKFDFDVSRYEPTISVVLREYKKKLIPFYTLEKEKKTVQSLRRTNLISVKKDIKNIWCIYIKGGMTYEEMSCIYKLSTELGIEFVIGSDKIIKAKDLIYFTILILCLYNKFFPLLLY